MTVMASVPSSHALVVVAGGSVSVGTISRPIPGAMDSRTMGETTVEVIRTATPGTRWPSRLPPRWQPWRQARMETT